MPRYFFDLQMAEGELEVDLEGVSLVDAQAAEREALRAMGEFLRDQLAQGKSEGFVIELSDEAGSVIARTEAFVRHEKKLK